MMYGFDCDQSAESVIDDAIDGGCGFVCRYLKNLHQVEVEALSEAGLLIVSIFETTAKRALAGRSAGIVDGTHALDQAVALGQPSGSAIYSTYDFDVTPEQEDTVLEYADGFKSAIMGRFKHGGYANGATLKLGLQQGLFDYTWLMGGRAEHGSKEFYATKTASIVQGVGDHFYYEPSLWTPLGLSISIDADIAFADDFGAWALKVVDESSTD